MNNPHESRPSSRPRVDHETAPRARHLYYLEEHYPDAITGIAAMRYHLEQGWQIALIRGPSSGPFVVMYQRDLIRESRDRDRASGRP